MYTGAVLQVVQTALTSVFSNTTNAAWVDVTGFTATITPSSTTSKILVTYNAVAGVTTAGSWGVGMKLVRNGTDIGVGDARGSTTRATTSAMCTSSNYTQPHAASFLDSPATTSAVTYKVQVWVESGAGNSSVGGSILTAQPYNFSVPTFMTLMEIAA
jgi:hypothetical protein